MNTFLSPEERQALKDRFARREKVLAPKPPQVAMLEKHYSIQFLAELWGWSEDFLRPIFLQQPGVMKVVRPEEVRNVHEVTDKNGNVRMKRGKREYISVRVPESVALRVYQRLVAK